MNDGSAHNDLNPHNAPKSQQGEVKHTDSLEPSTGQPGTAGLRPDYEARRTLGGVRCAFSTPASFAFCALCSARMRIASDTSGSTGGCEDATLDASSGGADDTPDTVD